MSINLQPHRSLAWLNKVFGSDTNIEERLLRMGEEVNELMQTGGVTREQAHALVDQVYDNPIGDMEQELGGVMVTLAAFCALSQLDPDLAYEIEAARCETPEMIANIRNKHATKAVVSASQRPPVFEYTEKLKSGYEEAFFGPNPFHDLERAKVKGRRVLVDGEVRTIKAIESFAKLSEPRYGEIIGVAFE
jgi:hypothetical protein